MQARLAIHADIFLVIPTERQRAEKSRTAIARRCAPRSFNLVQDDNGGADKNMCATHKG